MAEQVEVEPVNVLESQREYLEAITDPTLLMQQLDAESIYGPQFDAISLARTQTLLEGFNPQESAAYASAMAKKASLQARQQSGTVFTDAQKTQQVDRLLGELYGDTYRDRDGNIVAPQPLIVDANKLPTVRGGAQNEARYLDKAKDFYNRGEGYENNTFSSSNKQPASRTFEELEDYLQSKGYLIDNPARQEYDTYRAAIQGQFDATGGISDAQIADELQDVEAEITRIESLPTTKGLVQMADESARAAAQTQNAVNDALRQGDIESLERLGEQATEALRNADPQTKAIVEASVDLAKRATDAAEIGVQADQERNNLQAVANRQQARISELEQIPVTSLSNAQQAELNELTFQRQQTIGRAFELAELSKNTRTGVPSVEGLKTLQAARADIAAGRETAATARMGQAVGGAGTDIAALQSLLGAQQARQAGLETAAGANLLAQNTPFDIARDRSREAGTAAQRLISSARGLSGLAADREIYGKYVTPEQQALTALAQEAGTRTTPEELLALRDLAGTADLTQRAADIGTQAAATGGQAGVSTALSDLATAGAGLADTGATTQGQRDVRTRLGLNQTRAAAFGDATAATGAQQELRGGLDAADVRAFNIGGLGATTAAQQAQLNRLAADPGISDTLGGELTARARQDALATIQGRGSELYGADSSGRLKSLRGEPDLARTYAETQMGRGDTLFDQAAQRSFDPTGSIFRGRSEADLISAQARQLAEDATGPLSAERRRMAEQAARQRAARTGRLGDQATLAAELLGREESRAALRSEAREAARLATDLQGVFSDRALRAQEQARADALALGEAGLGAQQQAFSQQAALEQAILEENRLRRGEATEMEMDALAAQAEQAQARETQTLQRQVAAANERAQREAQIQSLTSQLVQQGLDAATASAQAEATVNQQRLALERDIAQQGITRGQTALDALNQIAQQRSALEAQLVAQGMSAAEAAQQAQQAALSAQADLETNIAQQGLAAQQMGIDAELASRQLGFQQARAAEQAIADEARALREEEVGLVQSNLARIDDLRRSAVEAGALASQTQANIAQMEFDEAARRRAEATQAADTTFAQQQAISEQRQAEEARRFEEAARLREEGMAEAQMAANQQQAIIDAQIEQRRIEDARQESLRADELAGRTLGAQITGMQLDAATTAAEFDTEEARRRRAELAAAEQTAFNTQAQLANIDAAEEQNLFNQAVTGQQLAFGQSAQTGGDVSNVILGRSSGAGGAGAGLALGAGAAGQQFAPLFDASAGTNLAMAQQANQAGLDIANLQADASATPTQSSGGSGSSLGKIASFIGLF